MRTIKSRSDYKHRLEQLKWLENKIEEEKKHQIILQKQLEILKKESKELAKKVKENEK